MIYYTNPAIDLGFTNRSVGRYTQLTIWHRHILLIAYLLFYAPQILGFVLYVFPSSIYKKEFGETSLAKAGCLQRRKVQ